MPLYLTQREREVLKGIMDGKNSKEVADKLFVSKRTVDFHLANIYGKLGVKTRMQAAIKVKELNIVL
jgi:DNA-binding NarL/FixJ family response regulator